MNYFYGEDSQPELYVPDDRNPVTFDKFEGFENSIKKLKKILANFPESKNQLFDAVIFGLMLNKQDNIAYLSGKHPDKKDAPKKLGDKLYFDLLEIESQTLLDWTLFGFFDRCYQLNRVLANHGYFLKFFERRNMYRFLIKKKAQGKNELTRKLSACVLEKFNRYEFIRHNLTRKEKVDFVPINVVYEPSFDGTVPVTCYFTNEIHQAYMLVILTRVKKK